MLVALRRLKHGGRVFNKGDAIDPAPDLALAAKLVRTGFAFPSTGLTVDAPAQVHACDVCGFAGTTPTALSAHRDSAHPVVSEPTVSASPGAPEPAGESNPPSPPAGALACPDCDRTFAGAQGLKVHRSRAHAGA